MLLPGECDPAAEAGVRTMPMGDGRCEGEVGGWEAREVAGGPSGLLDTLAETTAGGVVDGVAVDGSLPSLGVGWGMVGSFTFPFL